MNLAAAAAVSLLVQFGHNGIVGAVDITPDGKLVVSGGNDNVARLWDADTGRLLRVLSVAGDQNMVGVRFLPGAKRLITTSQDGNAREWDVDSGEHLRTVNVGMVHAMDISEDGGLMVIAGWSDGASLWDLRRFKRRRKFKAGSSPIMAAAISSDGRTVALGAQSGRIKLIDARTGKQKRTWQAHESPPVPKGVPGLKQQPPYFKKLAFSPDGKLLVSAAMQDLERAARVWNPAKGTEVAKVQVGQIVPSHVSFTPDGRRVLFGGFDVLLIWDVATKKATRQYKGVGHLVMAAACSADGKRLVTGDGNYGASVRVWDGDQSDDARVLGEKASVFERVRFSPDGQRVYSFDRSQGGEIRVWDVATLQPLRRFKVNVHGTMTGAMSPDEKLFYLPGVQTIRRVVASTGDELEPLKGSPNSVWKAEVSPDGRSLLLGTTHGHVELRDTDTGALIRRFTGESADKRFPAAVNGLGFSPDGERILACGSLDGSWRIWNAGTGKLLRSVKAYQADKHDNILSCALSPDGERVLTTGQHLNPKLRKNKVWDARSGKLLAGYGDLACPGRTGRWTPDGKGILASDFLGVELFDVKTRKRLRRFQGHTAYVADLDVSPNGQYMVTAGGDGGVVLWRLEDGQHTTLIGSGNDWVAYAADGVFDASRDGGRLVAMVQGRKAFAIDQFAVRNNRPDLLLERMGVGAAGLRDHYKRRWRRRVRKAAISEANAQPGMGSLEVPTATLAGAQVFGRKAQLAARCEDPKWPVVRRSVFVNGVPVQVAATGVPEVELTPGRNLIELSCLNAVGAESFRDQAEVHVDEEDHGDLWFVGFGVSQYKDASLNLQFAHQDVLDLAKVLAAKVGKGLPYRTAHVRSYVDAAATREAVKAAGEAIAMAKPEDTLVLFVAGHGMHDGSAEAEYFYLTHEADPKDLPGTAAPFSLFEDLLMKARPRRKLFLLDTCESGEADPDAETMRVAALTGSRGIKARSTRGVSFASSAKKQAPSASQRWRRSLVRRDRFIYNDLARRSGAVVFSSSRGGELSYESPDWQNGLFTEELVRALTTAVADRDRDGAVTARELRHHVSEAVGRVSKGAQNPVVDRDNIHQHISFPIKATRP